jgi:PAS domain S-box-containing protein
MSFNPQLGQGRLDPQVAPLGNSPMLSGIVSNLPGRESFYPVEWNSHRNISGDGVENISGNSLGSGGTFSSHASHHSPATVNFQTAHSPSPQGLPNHLSLTNASPIYITLNSAGMILAVNPSGAASLGYDAKNLIGQSVMSLFHPLDRIRLQTELLMLTAEHPVKRTEFCLINREGKSVEQIVTFQPFQTAEESGTLLICAPLDVQPAQKIYRLEQAQAEQVLRQQVEWERLMRLMARSACQSPDLRLMLRMIAGAVQQQLQADRVLVYQMHSVEAGSVVAEAFIPEAASMLNSGNAVATFQRKCIQLQTAVLNPTSQQSLPTLKTDVAKVSSSAAVQMAGQSEVIIPIVERDSFWGLLVVHQCRRSRQWQLWELGLLKQLATYLNHVIQQAELYQKVQRLNAELERQIHARTAELQLAFDFEATLKRITDNVRDSLDENEILETVVQELACAIGTNSCNASIYDLESGTSTICYEYTTMLSAYQGRVVQFDGSPEIYAQLLEGQSFQFCSLNINPTRGKVSMLTCPIVDDQGIMGDLWLINQPYYCFTEQDIRLVQQVANQCAIAIRQARLFQAAQTQVKELERLNQLKDDFLSTVSHELRTPMANIKMATQMLEVVLRQAGFLLKDNELKGADLRATKYFQILQTECQREINLINDLLDLSRLDTDQPILQQDTIDLPTWLTAIVQPFQARTHDQQQYLQLDCSPHLPHLTTDLPSLERIVTELLQNACKYTPSGETITVSARLNPGKLIPQGESPPPPSLLLSITNSGVEIPSPELSQVFEKFYRIPNNDPWQHGGTGLGLALVKKLTERLGGSVWAESHWGQTCFTVELPLVKAI